MSWFWDITSKGYHLNCSMRQNNENTWWWTRKSVLIDRESKSIVNSILALGSSTSYGGVCGGSTDESECCWELNMAALLSHQENKSVAIVTLCQSTFLKDWDTELESQNCLTDKPWRISLCYISKQVYSNLAI